MNSPWRTALLILVVAAAAMAGGFAAYRWRLQAAVPPPQTAKAPAASKQLPEVTLPDLEGKPRALSEWKGRPLLINFWATWCAPCRKEIPLLKELRAQYADQGLEVIGIAIDFRDDVAEYVGQAKIDYPILIAEQEATVTQAFGVGGGLPASVFVSASGGVTATQLGELHERLAQKLIEQALKAH
jgi:thiol-disulfide isomerase/thioredoxin